MEIENSLENIAPEERIIDGNLAQTSSCCVIINDQNADSSDTGDEKEKNELLKHVMMQICHFLVSTALSCFHC